MIDPNSKMQKVRELDYGTCLWQMPDGKYLADDGDHFLSMQGKIGDVEVHMKMHEHAIYWFGDIAKDGKPAWIEGARKVTDNEHDDQNERLRDGQIPDWEDEERQVLLKAKRS